MNKKWIDDLNKIWTKDLNGYLTKKDIQKSNKHEKLFSIINHQKNAS